MKNYTLILLLLLTVNIFSQEKQKCITVKEEKLPDYKIKVITTNHCVEPKEITIATYIITEWEKKKKKKRKTRKNDQ
tara:strand:- start:30 stop:260 length:231 start_codon:yes stop_codon:yes gene_type:complete